MHVIMATRSMVVPVHRLERPLRAERDPEEPRDKLGPSETMSNSSSSWSPKGAASAMGTGPEADAASAAGVAGVAAAAVAAGTFRASDACAASIWANPRLSSFSIEDSVVDRA